MPLTSMKRSKSEQEGNTILEAGVDDSTNDYSYGLRIRLEEPELKRIGLDEPKVGAELKLQAIGKIVAYSDDEFGRSVSILLTSLGTEDEPATDRTNVMYKQEG